MLWRSQSHEEMDWRNEDENQSLLLAAAAAQSVEMFGWAAVAERAMGEVALRAITEVEEPRGRAAVLMGWATAISTLAAAFSVAVVGSAAAVATDKRAALEEDVQLLEDRLCVSRAEAATARAAVEQLTQEKRAVEVSLAELRAESAATAQELAEAWDYVHTTTSGGTTEEEEEEEEEDSAVTGRGTTLPVKVRHVCARLLESEEARTALQDRVVALEEALTAAEEHLQSAPSPPPLLAIAGVAVAAQEPRLTEPAMLPVEAPHPTYDRLLPNQAVNPVTASLLRVREQVRRLRATSRESPAARVSQTMAHGGPDGTVRSPQPTTRVVDAAAAPGVFPRAVYMQAVTPLRRPLSRESAPREDKALTPPPHFSPRGPPMSAPTPLSAWRDRMSELQTELRSLRRDLGGAR